MFSFDEEVLGGFLGSKQCPCCGKAFRVVCVSCSLDFGNRKSANQMSCEEKARELSWLFGLNGAREDYLPMARRHQRVRELVGRPVNLLQHNAEERQQLIDQVCNEFATHSVA